MEVPRNARCPCGSGRRYKDCHGSLQAAAAHGGGAAERMDSSSSEPLAHALALDRRLLESALRCIELGDVAAARADLRRVLTLDDRHADALHLTATLDLAAGRADAARKAASSAIESYRRHAPFHVTHARALLALGERKAAEQALRVASGDDVERAEYWRIEGSALVPSGPPLRRSIGDDVRATPADARGKRSVDGRPLEVARRHLEMGEVSEAEALLRAVLSEVDCVREAWPLLVRVLREMARHEDIVTLLQNLPADSDDEPARVAAMAFSLVESGRTDEARAALALGVQTHPGSLRLALPAALALKPVYRSVSDVLETRAGYAAGLDRLWSMRERFAGLSREELLASLEWCNFYLPYQGGNDLELQVRYGEFVADLTRKAAPHLRLAMPRPDTTGRRVRIGFASHYFYECSAGRYFAGWVNGLDRGTFETFVYHLRDSVDGFARALARRVDHFATASGGTFLGDRIAADHLDILVYPELGGDGRTLLLAALRLAPIQCAGWGHPATTGLETIDYFFSSELAEPPDGASHYSEHLVLLPGIGIDYEPPGRPPTANRESLRAAFGLPAGSHLYLFPHSVYKIHPDNDLVLGEVLAADPQGVLLLFPGHTPGITHQFLQRLERHLRSIGIDIRARVTLLPFVTRETYLAINAACDVMVDSLHWSGGNTSLDAIAAGLPIATLPGSLMRGRQTLSMLTAMGLDELVARDPPDLVRLAVRIASDTGLRARLQQAIAERRSAVFGDRRAIAAMSRFYRDVVGRPASAGPSEGGTSSPR